MSIWNKTNAPSIRSLCLFFSLKIICWGWVGVVICFLKDTKDLINSLITPKRCWFDRKHSEWPDTVCFLWLMFQICVSCNAQSRCSLLSDWNSFSMPLNRLLDQPWPFHMSNSFLFLMWNKSENKRALEVTSEAFLWLDLMKTLNRQTRTVREIKPALPFL